MLIGNEHVGVAVLGLQVALRKMIVRLRRQPREVEALAPDQHQIGRVVERCAPCVDVREQRARRRGVRVLVRRGSAGRPRRARPAAATQSCLTKAAKRVAERLLEGGELFVGAPVRHERRRALRPPSISRRAASIAARQLDRLALQHRLLGARRARRSARGRGPCCRSTAR